MLLDTPNLRVTLEHGTATLWLGFPGESVNALDLSRLRELDAAIATIAANRAVRVLVVRSAKPSGFCAGLRPEVLETLPHPTQRANFAWYGQQVFERIAALDAVTVALIDGPCLGAGFELALACDYRVCVARPTTHLGFPDTFACFGGSARLRALGRGRASGLVAKGNTLSGREARDLGLVDVACCDRRKKIELRTFLDRIEDRPVKPARPELAGLADERRAFSSVEAKETRRQGDKDTVGAFTPRLLVSHSPPPSLPLPPLPATVGLLGSDASAARIAAEAVLRGGSAVVCGDRAPLFKHIETSLTRGFVTPLEAEQARLRVRGGDTLAGFDGAGLVFVAEGHDPFRLAAVVRPRTVVCVIRPNLASRPNAHPPVPFPHPRRVIRISFGDPGRVGLFPGTDTATDTTDAVAAWLAPFGLIATTFPAAARLLPRAA